MRFVTGRGFAEVAHGEEAEGTYIAWLLSPESAQNINGWARLMGVTNVVPAHEMHATIMHSSDEEVPAALHGDHPLRWPVSVDRHGFPRTEVLGRPGSPGALVTTFDSGPMAERHRFWRDTADLRHSFDDYLPHVTLSYDASSVPEDVYRRLREAPCQLPMSFDRERVAWCK